VDASVSGDLSAENDGDSGGAAREEAADQAGPGLAVIPAQVRQAVHHGVEGDLHLLAGDVLAQARVRAAAEGQRALHAAEDVELVGILPAGRVAVGRSQAQVDDRAFRHQHALDLDVLGRAAREDQVGRVPTSRFQDHPGQQAAVGAQLVELVLVVEQGVEGDAELAPGGAAAGQYDQPAVVDDLLVGEAAD